MPVNRRTLLRAALLIGLAAGTALPAWAQPTASLVVSPNPQNEGQALTLDASASQRDPATLAPIVSYQFFQDGAALTAPTPSPTFQATAPQVAHPNTQAFPVYTVIITDSNSEQGRADQQETINDVNQNPQITAANAAPNPANPGQTVALSVSATDPDGDTLSYSWTQTGGTAVTINNANTATPNFVAPSVTANEDDTFHVVIVDGFGGSTASDVVVHIQIPNHPPVAQDQNVSTKQATPAPITLTATDQDNDPLTYSIVTPPSHGALSGVPPNVSYTSVTGYSGPDSFTFKANDGQLDSNVATVTIAVVAANSPTVNAGQDGTAIELSSTALSGIITDPDSQLPITYAWTQVSGSSCTILNATGTISSLDSNFKATVHSEFVSGNVSANSTVTFRLTATDSQGNVGFDDVVFTIQDVSGAKAGAVPLISNVKTFPSPFSPSRGGATIRYTLRSASDVHVIISDIFGREVREINADAGQSGGTAGDNDLHWDGKNGDGEDVGNGAYTVQVRARDLNGAEGKSTDRVGVRK